MDKSMGNSETVALEAVDRQETMPSVLQSYANQGRLFLSGAALNLIQFGRVLVEAKPLVPHGQFETWIHDNFSMSKSTAESYMAVYRRFGNNDKFTTLQFSQLRTMLRLEPGTEERFLQAHDVGNMTARETTKAVDAEIEAARAEGRKQGMEQAKAEIDKERAARMEAQKMASGGSAQVEEALRKELQSERSSAQAYRDEITRLSNANREIIDARNQLQRELNDKTMELTQANEMLQESQKAYDDLQSGILNTSSLAAKGDVQRQISEQLTSEDFADAVRCFMGRVSQMPLMGKRFAVMGHEEYAQYADYLDVVQDWARRSREALNVVGGV